MKIGDKVYFIDRINNVITEDRIWGVCDYGVYEGCILLTQGRWAFPSWGLVHPFTPEGKRQAEARVEELNG